MRYFLSLCASLGVLFFFAPCLCAAADPAADAMQNRYAAVRSMRAEFTQTLTHKESGNVENRAGVLFFAKPLKVRWETTSPVPELLLITQQAVWNAFPDEGVAYTYPAGLSESETIVRMLTGQSALETDFIVENKGTEKNLTRLALYPKNPAPSMTEAELMVDAESGLIHAARIVDFYNNINEITFSRQDLTADLPDSVFVFTPAAGMKVEDRTGGGPVSRPLMQ